jgi:uncharacterized membrane protein YeiH
MIIIILLSNKNAMDYLLLVDILGVIAFAISGVLAAMRKHFDPFGILIIAFVASVGGGTLRDLLLGFPVAWMRNMTYISFIIGTTIFAIIFRKKLSYFRRSLFLFDTIGIALYTVVGVEKAIEANFSPIICVAMGTLSACFGGVIRDLLCGNIPTIFKTKEIYATACILGGTIYFILLETTLFKEFSYLIAGGVVVLARTLAVIFNIQLPSIYSSAESED